MTAQVPEDLGSILKTAQELRESPKSTPTGPMGAAGFYSIFLPDTYWHHIAFLHMVSTINRASQAALVGEMADKTREIRDLLHDEPGLAGYYRQLILDFIRESGIMTEFDTSEKTVLDGEAIERLKALGYLDN